MVTLNNFPTQKKRTHKILKPSEKKKICEYSISNPSATQLEISDYFSELFGQIISRRTIGDILKDKFKWLENRDNRNKLCLTAESHPRLESALLLWFNSAREKT